MLNSSIPSASPPMSSPSRWQRLRRRLIPIGVSSLLLGSVALAELPSAAHVWVLAVNGSLTVRDANSLRFMGQGPVTAALALTGNRKRIFGVDVQAGRLFEIHSKTLATVPVVDVKEPISGLCANADGSRVLLISNAKKSVLLVDTAAKQAAVVASDVTRVKGCLFGLDGLSAYLVPAGAEDLITIDVKNSKVAGKLAVAAPPSRIGDLVIHPNPAKKLALLADGTRILYLDTATNKPQGMEIAVGVPIRSLVFHPNGQMFFALADDKLFWIDLQTRQIQKSLELAPGGSFRTMAIDGQGKRLYISGNHDINEGLGAVINTQGKEFVAVDVETRKKSYFDYAPVRTVEFVVSP